MESTLKMTCKLSFMSLDLNYEGSLLHFQLSNNQDIVKSKFSGEQFLKDMGLFTYHELKKENPFFYFED